MRTRIMILFMAIFLLCGCSDAPAVHKYELPDGLSFAERQYENGYKKYLKGHSDNWEEDWQFHLKVRYYSEDWPEFRLKGYYSPDESETDSEEDEPYKIDAGIVDFNMFYMR